MGGPSGQIRVCQGRSSIESAGIMEEEGGGGE